MAGHILVVDDNAANRLLAQVTLEDEDFEVATASSGAEALAAFERAPADCVLMDVRMPDMDGFATCERLRALPSGQDVPVIFVTALRDVDTFDQAFRAGGNDFMSKPARPDELLMRVRLAMRASRREAVDLDLLERQRRELLRLQLQRERLSAYVVHDLKGPVHALGLLGDLVKHDASLSPAARDTVRTMQQCVRQLDRMVGNLIDIARADGDVLTANRAPAEVAAIVAAVLSDLAPLAAHASVRVASDVVPGVASIDAEMIRRVLANLVDNAIRHAPRGTAVRVCASWPPGALELRVSDEGAGIPAPRRAAVFDPFVSGARRKPADGRVNHGLGLTFCRHAALAHGGDISIEDGDATPGPDAGPGTVFRVRIPTDAS